jgi:hypothetical protein
VGGFSAHSNFELLFLLPGRWRWSLKLGGGGTAPL